MGTPRLSALPGALAGGRISHLPSSESPQTRAVPPWRPYWPPHGSEPWLSPGVPQARGTTCSQRKALSLPDCDPRASEEEAMPVSQAPSPRELCSRRGASWPLWAFGQPPHSSMQDSQPPAAPAEKWCGGPEETGRSSFSGSTCPSTQHLLPSWGQREHATRIKSVIL